MAKGSIAKENLVNKFKSALGADYVGYDADSKKYYFWSSENGERMQVAVTMTVPKVPFAGGAEEVASGDLDFSTPTPVSAQVAISASEQENLDRLMKELGL